MKFDFEPIALVEEKKKYSEFTITPIGGPEEIGKWREMQAAKETVYRMRLKSKDDRITSFEKELGTSLSRVEPERLSWKERLSVGLEEIIAFRKRQKEAEDFMKSYEDERAMRLKTLQEKPAFKEKVKKFIKSIWNAVTFKENE